MVHSPLVKDIYGVYNRINIISENHLSSSKTRISSSMAYYSYNNHSIDNQGEFNRDYYYYNYSLNSNYSPYNHHLPLEDSIAISNYKNSIDPQIFPSDPIIPSSISYSISSPSDPKYIQYDPTQFVISYSVSASDFNETENFEEYDTTPYGGGYNLNLTYGNPLPPSDDICYPRSSSAAAPPATLPSIGVPATPIATHPAKAEAESKSNDSGLKSGVVKEESDLTAFGRQNGVVEGEESNLTASGRQNGVVGGEESNFGSGAREVGYEVNEEMPYGYGLEAMDICEGLFGYWPCVAKCRRRLDDYQQGVDCGGNPWDGTADYLFGNPNPYVVETREVDDYNTYGQNFWGS